MPDLSELIKQASEVKARHEDDLLARPGVVGVGVGLHQQAGQPTDQVAIIIMIEQPVPDLPQQIEGFTVDVLNTGTISAE